MEEQKPLGADLRAIRESYSITVPVSYTHLTLTTI